MGGTTHLNRSEIWAAEYALGLLPPRDRVEAERRMACDAHFASRVAQWRGRLASLFGSRAPVRPRPHLWPRIEAALDAASPARAGQHRRDPVLAAVATSAVLALIFGVGLARFRAARHDR